MKPIYSLKISSKIGTSEHLADQDITYKYSRFKTLGKYETKKVTSIACIVIALHFVVV